MKISIAGTGYMGLSMAVLLAQRHEVVALDIVPAKVDMINQHISSIHDAELQHYLALKQLNLRATLNKQDAYTGADFVIIATPTDYDPITNHFNTGSVEAVIQDVMAITPRVVNNLAAFMQEADVIIANRKTPDLAPVGHKVYTRDLFGSDQ